MAERVMSMDVPTIQTEPIQNQERESPIRRQMISSWRRPEWQPLPVKPAVQLSKKDDASTATPNLESRLASQTGGGTPLNEETRSFMEPRFGADFSAVRVHTDSSSVQMNQELGAQAFTHGHDVYFGGGKYNPGADDGKRLLAHELTHVVQQTGAVPSKSGTNVRPKSNKIQKQSLLTPSLESTSIIQSKQQTPEQETKYNFAAPIKPEPSSQKNDQQIGEVKNTDEQLENSDQPNAEGALTAKQPEPSSAETSSPASDQQTQNSLTTAKAGGVSTGKQNQSHSSTATPASTSKGAKAPTGAANDSGYQEVIHKVKGVAQQQQKHPPAGSKAQEAQAAAQPPANEVPSKAQANQVGDMGQVESPGFDSATFKAKLMERIADMAPKNLKEADEFKNNNQLDSVKGDLSGKVKDEQKKSQDPLEEKTQEAPNTSGIETKPVTPIPAPEPGVAPSDINAEKAVPKAKGQNEVEAPLQEDSQKLDQQMADAKITDEQLANSNEPDFQGVVTAKKEAKTSAEQSPLQYRQQEQTLLTTAKTTAEATAQQNLQGMQAVKTENLSQVSNQQVGAKGKDEQARTKVAGDINKIYEDTKTKVQETLDNLDGQVQQAFDTGAGQAKKAFEDYIEKQMNAYKDARYGGLTGKAQWVADQFMGLPSEVNIFYEEGRKLYIQEMDGVINKVVEIVSKGLTQAKTDITNGKQDIQKYVQQLPQDLQAVGQEAATDIQGKFDELQQSVNDKEGELINTLAQKYQESLQTVDARIDEMKAANKGLFAKAFDLVAGVIKTIIQLTQMLMQVLARAAAAVGDILKNPIQFLSNLIQAVKQGFLNFVKNMERA